MLNRTVIFQDTGGDLTHWDCGCAVLYEEDGILVQPCESERCPVVSNLMNHVDPVVAQDNASKIFRGLPSSEAFS